MMAVWALAIFSFHLGALLMHYVSITDTKEAVTLNFSCFVHSHFRTEMSLYVVWTKQSFVTTRGLSEFFAHQNYETK